MLNFAIIGADNYDMILQKIRSEIEDKLVNITCLFATKPGYYFNADTRLHSIEEIGECNQYLDYYIIADNDELYWWNYLCNQIPEDKIILGRVITKYIGFDLFEYLKLKASNISIISDSCWGGMVYHNLGMRFATPLVNTAVEKEDFFKLILNLEYYMSCPLEKYKERSATLPPVGILGGEVKIGLNHYTDFYEGKKAWERRVDRINYNNIFIEMDTIESEKDVELFKQCKYEKKVAFTKNDYSTKSLFYMKQWDDVNVRIKSGSFRGYVQNIISDCPAFPRPMDVEKMLNGSMDYIRM
ncbi:DUF1919 domain-containing protein [Pseudobutyrivibrio sp.]|uniref:DUF1919 domain-containing protein n=1 Tax=Pseudobutyrivibrio sp. TaxID=2014367 RepID=UPI0025D7D4F3|nr:DUF1919 domain-containing protein [Pseudobutyrivibrio sp.]